ncbi:MAG: hypothetical protein U0736_18240 [Gemmataceae bacterium]
MSTPSTTPAEPATLRRWIGPRLLAWFALHRRDLPWRRDRDPYRIWVSEVMLQQTQVATVVPYFDRFLTRFPTLADLAAADLQDVLRLWEGLGYYRRARDLHRAAGQLVAAHGGAFPADPSALTGLPGFGDYTRNAVLSQAFDLRLPILEANSQRVLSRLFGREASPQESAARRWLWQAAEAVLPTRQAGDFNQALMELGAVSATPTARSCTECPLARLSRQPDGPAGTDPGAADPSHDGRRSRGGGGGARERGRFAAAAAGPAAGGRPVERTCGSSRTARSPRASRPRPAPCAWPAS